MCEGSHVELRTVNHPLVEHKVTLLRDRNTDSQTFRALVSELVMLLSYEATREIRVETIDVITPIAATTGVRLALPRPLVVPILRAGLGMLDGILRLLPSAEVGFIGLRRDEETLQPITYAERLPKDLSNRQCYVLDPMLATGGSLAETVRFLVDRGASEIICITLFSAPEGIALLGEVVDSISIPCTLITAAVDERLNENGYIVPGLGDAGDRLYGLAE